MPSFSLKTPLVSICIIFLFYFIKKVIQIETRGVFKVLDYRRYNLTVNSVEKRKKALDQKRISELNQLEEITQYSDKEIKGQFQSVLLILQSRKRFPWHYN